LQAEFEKVDVEWDAANQAKNDEDDEVFSEIDAKRDKLQEQLEEVEEELGEYKSFDPEDIKTAGCYLTIGHDGKIAIDRGLVRPEDKKAIARGETPVAGESKPKEKGFSQALVDSMKQYRLQIARAALTENPEIDFDLLVSKAAHGTLTNNHLYTGPDVSFSSNHFRGNMLPDAKTTRGQGNIRGEG